MKQVEKKETFQSTWRKFRNFPQFSILVALILLCIILAFTAPTFFTAKNIINVLRQSSTSLIVAMGMTFVLILGGIDLSVGAVACLAGTLCAGLMAKNGIPVLPALLIGVGVGVVCGLINGLLVAKLGIAPFVATLAMNCTARGVALVYSGGYPITGMPEVAQQLGRGYILKVIPVPVVIMMVIVAVCWIVLRMTKFSRHVFAIGGNEECARLSGIKVGNVKIKVYAICGAMAAITGILLTMRLASGQPTLGEGLELDAISAVVLGGTSMNGGKGYVLGTILGCLFLTVMGNGLNILQINSFWQQVLQGIILICAVSMYERKKR